MSQPHEDELGPIVSGVFALALAIAGTYAVLVGALHTASHDFTGPWVRFTGVILIGLAGVIARRIWQAGAAERYPARRTVDR